MYMSVPVPVVPVGVDFGLRSAGLLLLRSALRVLLVKHVLMLRRACAL